MICPLGSSSAILLGTHVDALELSWAPSTRARVAGEPTDALGRVLSQRKFEACRAGRPVALDDWHWNGEPVVVLPHGVRSWSHAIECQDWLGMFDRDGSRGPRGLFQLRAEYLANIGAASAIEAVTSWADDNLLSATRREADWPVEWRVARIDLAADLAGVSLKATDLERFTSRAVERKLWWETATAHEQRKTFTGFQFGRRGGALHARVYLKSHEAKANAPIRERWQAAGYMKERHGADVWRVELEVRPQLLRTLHVDGQPLPKTPQALVAQHLPTLWNYGLDKWLVLRCGNTSRIERSRPEEWWAELAEAQAGFGEAAPCATKRQAALPADPDRLLRLIAGSLSSYAAATGLTTWTETAAALDRYIRRGIGTGEWAETVAFKAAAGNPATQDSNETDLHGGRAWLGTIERPYTLAEEFYVDADGELRTRVKRI